MDVSARAGWSVWGAKRSWRGVSLRRDGEWRRLIERERKIGGEGGVARKRKVGRSWVKRDRGKERKGRKEKKRKKGGIENLTFDRSDFPWLRSYDHLRIWIILNFNSINLYSW
jgi:hypothetical protein